MKINIKQILSLSFISLLLFSCGEKDDYTGDSVVVFSAPTATVTLAEGNTVTVQESAIAGASKVFTFEASIPEAVPFDTYIDLTQIGGTATAEDFSIERIKIPAYALTGTGTVTINKSGNIEGDETLEIGTNVNSPNVNGNETYSFNITDDYVNDNLQITFGWCKDFSFTTDGVTTSGNYGEVIDIDIVTSPANDTAATGDCPEVLEFGGFPDGEYLVAIQVYSTSVSENGWDEVIPIEISYSQEYVLEGSTTVDHSVVLNSDSGSGILGLALKVIKTGYNYEVIPM